MIQARSLTLGMVLTPLLALAAVAVFAAPATVPNTFAAGAVISSASVNANFVSLRDAINSNIPTTTVLTYTTSATDATVSGTYELLKTVGTFTKTRADTQVIVTWNSNTAQVGAAGQFAEYQVRIDGAQSPNGNFTGATCYMDTASAFEQVSSSERFTGLTVGLHTVEIWSRGTCTSLVDDFSNFTSKAIVVEQFSN